MKQGDGSRTAVPCLYINLFVGGFRMKRKLFMILQFWLLLFMLLLPARQNSASLCSRCAGTSGRQSWIRWLLPFCIQTSEQARIDARAKRILKTTKPCSSPNRLQADTETGIIRKNRILPTISLLQAAWIISPSSTEKSTWATTAEFITAFSRQ